MQYVYVFYVYNIIYIRTGSSKWYLTMMMEQYSIARINEKIFYSIRLQVNGVIHDTDHIR